MVDKYTEYRIFYAAVHALVCFRRSRRWWETSVGFGGFFFFFFCLIITRVGFGVAGREKGPAGVWEAGSDSGTRAHSLAPTRTGDGGGAERWERSVPESTRRRRLVRGCAGAWSLSPSLARSPALPRPRPPLPHAARQLCGARTEWRRSEQRRNCAGWAALYSAYVSSYLCVAIM